MNCDLQRHFEEFERTCPFDGGKPLLFSSDTFGEPIAQARTENLVVIKRCRTYEGSIRVDRLAFRADKATYRRLGLLILSVVFRGGHARTHLVLTNASSEIRNLIVTYDGTTLRRGGQRTRPDAFLYHVGPVETHPWPHDRLDIFSLPRFVLTNMKDFLLTEEDWATRDTVTGFGNDDAACRLAAMLLNISATDNHVDEVVLEGPEGFRGVGLNSAEAAFYLPSCAAWPGSS